MTANQMLPRFRGCLRQAADGGRYQERAALELRPAKLRVALDRSVSRPGQTLRTLGVAELEPKARCMVETGGKAPVRGADDDRPVVLVPVGVADDGVQHEEAGEHVKARAHCANRRRRTDTVQRVGDGLHGVSDPVVFVARSDSPVSQQLIAVDENLGVLIDDASAHHADPVVPCRQCHFGDRDTELHRNSCRNDFRPVVPFAKRSVPFIVLEGGLFPQPAHAVRAAQPLLRLRA